MLTLASRTPDAPRMLEPLEPRLLCSASVAPLERLAAANNAFAYELYQQVRSKEGNLLFSPLSISAALAMVYAGAAGRTAEEMGRTLHFDTLGQGVHEAFGDLLGELASRNMDDPADPDRTVILDIANAIWGQEGYPFLDSFLDLLADCYDGGFESIDFRSNPEAARGHINEWIADQTRNMITNALPPGFITDYTKMVLANAVYFNAGWKYAFDPADTVAWEFSLAGTPVAKMMHMTATLKYSATDDYQAVELPYVGDQTSMLVVLPKEGRFEAFESSLSSAVMDSLIAGLHPVEVRLYLPQLDYSFGTMLAGALSGMGMPSAFGGGADFSGMDGTHDLCVSDVLHKAVIKVDESGSEAAAVTVIGVGTTSINPPKPQPVLFVADQPFLYTIRDIPTDTTLFMGRVSDGSALVAADAEPVAPPVGKSSTWPIKIWRPTPIQPRFVASVFVFNQPFNGLSPAPYFDERFYLQKYADVRSAVEAGEFSSGLEHLLSFGAKEGRTASGLFDEQFYLRRYQDVAQAISVGQYRSGFEHYVVFGADEGRNPSGFFDEAYYAHVAYPDIAAAVEAGVYRNGFEHYMRFGAAEGRNPSGFFVEQAYRGAETDVAQAIEQGLFRSALEHYMRFGAAEGRAALYATQSNPGGMPSYTPAFDASWYLLAYSDVAAAVAAGIYHNGLEHFALYGWGEGRERMSPDDPRPGARAIYWTGIVDGRGILYWYFVPPAVRIIL